MTATELHLLKRSEFAEIATVDSQLVSLFRQTKNILGIPTPEKAARRRILGFIKDNNDTSRFLQTSEFLSVVDKEKELKGDCKLGVLNCIDGRVSIIHQFGRNANNWEVAGSLVESEQRQDKKMYLTSQRLINALEKIAASTEGRELLEIVTAHTSGDPNHMCGKMTEVARKNGRPPNEVNNIALAAAELRAQAIENKYNEILTEYKKPPQEQVSVVAMVETDTMGMSLNFGKENVLSTTNILMNSNLKSEIEASNIAARVGKFGSMKNLFTEKDSIVEYSTRVEQITRYLMSPDAPEAQNPAVQKMATYIEENYSKLTKNQKQALLFTLCRTIANQYVTGLSGEHFDHPFNEHDEKYISVSPFGKPFGRFDYTKQTFGSTPNSREDALGHVKTKLSIMDNHEKVEGPKEPHIIFISNPIKKGLLDNKEFTNSSTYAQVIDSNRKYYDYLLGDPEIRKKVDAGEIIVVPLLVDEDTGETLSILENSSFYVTQGEPISDMPPLAAVINP